MRSPLSMLIAAAGAAFLALAPAQVDAHAATPAARQPALVAQTPVLVTLTVAATQHLVATAA